MAQNFYTWALIFVLPLIGAHPVCSQEEEQMPSQNTSEALQRFSKFPSVVKKRLQAIEEKARRALQDAADTRLDKKAEPDSPTLPKRTERSNLPHYSAGTRRDPFAPPPSGPQRPAKKPLSPLEQFELGQLKLVGIVWHIKEPRAIVEDSNGLGYTIKVGTPIGTNDGKVKAINLNGVIIEEHYVDVYGAHKSREYTMKLPAD